MAFLYLDLETETFWCREVLCNKVLRKLDSTDLGPCSYYKFRAYTRFSAAHSKLPSMGIVIVFVISKFYKQRRMQRRMQWKKKTELNILNLWIFMTHWVHGRFFQISVVLIRLRQRLLFIARNWCKSIAAQKSNGIMFLATRDFWRYLIDNILQISTNYNLFFKTG